METAARSSNAVPVMRDVLALLDDLEVIPYTADREGRITWIGGAVLKLLGYSPAEILGREPTLFVAGDGLEQVREQLQRKLIGDAKRTVYEVTALAKDGSRVPLQVVSAPLFEDGKIIGVRGVAIGRQETTSARGSGLTPRQHEVLQLLAEGLTTNAIAERLEISEQTARNHIRAVLAALNSHSRLQAVAAARRAGMI
jgi:PAS domain S-box-containing protein